MTTSYAKPIPSAQSAFESAREHAQETERALTTTEMMKAPHDSVEAFVHAQAQEWARRMLQAQVLLRAERERHVEVVGADGQQRRSVRETQRQLETIVGRITVPRLAYKEAGCCDLHTMDAAINLPPELYSYGLRRMVAKVAARASINDVIELVDAHTGGHSSTIHVDTCTW